MTRDGETLRGSDEAAGIERARRPSILSYRPSLLDAWGIAAQVAVLWISLAVLSIVFSLVIDGSALRNLLLPAALRRRMIASELSLLAIPAGVIGGIVAILGQIIERRLGKAAAMRKFCWLGLCTFVCIPVGLYVSSWVGFLGTDRFLDGAGFRFVATNPVQFFQHAAHMDPLVVVAAPVLVVLGSFAWAWGLQILLARLARPPLLAITGLALAGVAVAFNFSGALVEDHLPSLGKPVRDPEVGTVYNYDDLVRSCREDRSGPILHALADLGAYGHGSVREIAVDESIEIRREPIITLPEYLHQVDEEKVKHWNVIVVLVESLRPDQLESFGGRRVVMPGVEAVAREARRFPDHYTQASHSNYADLCPLSSHYPLRSPRTHVYSENPSYPRVLIYDILKAMGWHTAIISSQNEMWGGMINYLRTGAIDHFFHSETFEGETYVPRNDIGFQRFVKGTQRSGKIDDRFTIEEAIRWTGSLPEDEPFFLYLNLQNSHLPYETPADFPRRFGPDQVPFAIRFAGYPRHATNIVKDIYADSLAYTDFQLDKLIMALKGRGDWDRTLFVLTSDTGQAFYEHGFVAHANAIFNEVMKVPLIIRAPGIVPGVDPRPAQHIDVPPSILDLLGLPPHPSFQGESLFAPDPKSNRSRFILAQAPGAHQYGVIRNGFKLIHDVRWDRMFLLDLMEDPGERVDVIDQHPQLARTLRLRLDTWRRNQLEYYRDPALRTRTYPPVLID